MKFSLTVLLVIILNMPTPSYDEVRIIDVDTLERIMHDPESGIRVINFWATWCKPCIEELPYFEALRDNPAFNEVEVILISLDFSSDLNSRVSGFMEKNDIHSTVYLLDNTDYNSWINKVDPTWSGAIPATLMIDGKSGERRFFEKQFKFDELENELIDFITKTKP